MLEPEEIKDLIADSIKSAVCIDDQYAEPYQKAPKNGKDAEILYHSFRQQGKCDLDIYNYNNLEDFIKAREYLFCNKELLILDWELSPSAQNVYEDSLKILEDAINNSYIQFITIYTQAPSFNEIVYRIFSYFYFNSMENNSLRKEKYKNLTEEIEDALSEINSDLSSDDLEEAIRKYISGYSIYPNKQQHIESEIKAEIFNKVDKKEQGRICKLLFPILNRYGFGTYREFYLWYELYYSTKDDILEIVREDQTPLPLKVLNIDNTTPALLINNTVIFVLEKQKGTNEGITPKDVFHKICQIISTITNCRSLILSLRLKLIINEKLAILGKGLGGLNEEALVYHANSYNDKTNEGRFEYLISCLTNHINQNVIDNLDYPKLEKLFKEENIKEPEDKHLAALNAFLTFTSKNKMYQWRHQLKSGDIFKLEVPILHESNLTPEIEYIICITQSCDCLRPEKVNYNFAFTSGKSAILSTALSKVQTDCYSFINDHEAIQWSNKFFTLNLKNSYIFNINDKIPVILNDGKPNHLEYIGNQKEIFSQRIINATFNRASRMGVDLPEKKEKNCKKIN